MMWDLPVEVKIDEKNIYHITNKCDYRVVLDVFDILNDNELSNEEKAICSLIVFYEELNRENIYNCFHINELQEQMFYIINNGEAEESSKNSPKLMDWKHDFKLLAPPISKFLGYDVRTPNKFTHWHSFVGAYMEMGDCTFSTVVSIRSKRAKGEKLDKWESNYIQEHRKMVELPQTLTTEEEEALNSQW